MKLLLLMLLLGLIRFVDSERKGSAIDYDAQGKQARLRPGDQVPDGAHFWLRDATLFDLSDNTQLGGGRWADVALAEGHIQLKVGRLWLKREGTGTPLTFRLPDVELQTDGAACELFVAVDRKGESQAWVQQGNVTRNGDRLPEGRLPYNPDQDYAEPGVFRCGNDGPKNPYAWLAEPR